MAEWIAAKSQETGKAVYINVENVTAVENRERGARIWFVGGDRDSAFDISETAEDFLGRAGEIDTVEHDTW